jgi:hypothetical protein
MTWVPPSCTLPTADQPLRVAEFDDLLAGTTAERPAPERLTFRLEPTPEVAAHAAGLAARETACCSFFTFALTVTAGMLTLDVTVPPAHVSVLDALAGRTR